jgi:hypothetical protein
MWNRADEWVGHAPCGQDPIFTIAPYWDPEDTNEDTRKLTPDEVSTVQNTCAVCPVRPECIEDSCVKRKDNSVWIAGVWLCDTYDKINRKALNIQRDRLIQSLPAEREARPDALL